MADDDKDWEDVPAKKGGGTATATAGGDWEDVPSKESATPAETPAPEQKEPTFLEKAAQGKASLWDTVKHAANPLNIPGDVSETLGKVGDWAQKKAEDKQTESLGNIAKGTAQPTKPNELGSSASDAYDLLGRVAHMGSGATSPTNVAIAGATVAAPEIMGPALIAHGGYNAIKAGSDIADKGANPENVENLLTSGSEIAGGGASLGEIPKMGGLKNTLTGKVAGKAVDTLGNPLTIGMAGEDMVTKGVRPRARATGWQDAMQSPGVQREILKYNAQTPIKGVEDFKDAIPEMKQKLWDEKIQPALDRQGPRPVDMKPVGQAVRNAITPEMREFNPNAVAGLEDLASRLEKSRTVEEASGLRKYVNGQLDTYFNKYPTARRSAMTSDPETMGWETARRAIQDQLGKTLEDAGETETQPARKDYGHLTTLEKELERKVNVNDRSKPTGLYNFLGTAGGIGALLTGHGPLAAGLYGVGKLAEHFNAPDTLVRRGIEKLNPPAAAPFNVPAPFTPPAKVEPTPFRAPEAIPTAPPNAAGAVEGIGSIQNPNLVGARGQGGVRTPVHGLLPERIAPHPGPVRGPQMGLNIPAGPEEAPLFNLPNINAPRNVPELQRIGGTQTAAPVGMAHEGSLPPIGGAGREGTLSRIGGGTTKPSGVSLGAGEDLGEGLGTQHVITKDGQRIGSITVEPKDGGKTLHVHWLGGDFGPGLRPQLMDEVERLYPKAEKFTYDRRRLAKGAEAATTEQREMKIKKMVPPKT